LKKVLGSKPHPAEAKAKENFVFVSAAKAAVWLLKKKNHEIDTRKKTTIIG